MPINREAYITNVELYTFVIISGTQLLITNTHKTQLMHINIIDFNATLIEVYLILRIWLSLN